MPRRPRSPKKPGRPPTICDVARRAGVSPATVSNALSGRRGVTELKRRAVQEAVASLGYQSNHMASSLRTGATRTIGVVVPNLANEFFAGLVRRWEVLLSQNGYEMLVVASGEDPATEARRVDALIARRIEGLLVVAACDNFGASPGFPANLPPVVLVDRGFGHPKYDTVASDNSEAGYRGTLHLLELGHRDITLLISDTEHSLLNDRIEGYRRALNEAGLGDRERVVLGGGTVEGCRSAIEQDLRRPNPPTAIFACTFYATVGAVKAISALNISFPKEISLLGFEHSEWMTALRPYISSVNQSVETLAERSWHTLRERLDGRTGKPARVIVPFRYNFRESSRPPQGLAATPRPSGSRIPV